MTVQSGRARAPDPPICELQKLTAQDDKHFNTHLDHSQALILTNAAYHACVRRENHLQPRKICVFQLLIVWSEALSRVVVPRRNCPPVFSFSIRPA